eukprot:768808-Hanusia_phi.AAC.1
MDENCQSALFALQEVIEEEVWQQNADPPLDLTSHNHKSWECPQGMVGMASPIIYLVSSFSNHRRMTRLRLSSSSSRYQLHLLSSSLSASLLPILPAAEKMTGAL